MTQTEKFLFETTFDADGQIVYDAATSGPKRSYTPDEVDEIKKSAYAEGLTGVEAQVAQQNAQIMGQISESMVRVITHLEQEVKRIQADATQLAVAVAKRLCANMLEREPETEIIALIERCLDSLPAEPHIVVRVAEGVSADLKPTITEMAAQKGFDGKILVVPEPALDGADCRIEWADGGVERDTQSLIEKVEAIVNQHLEAEQAVQGDLFDHMNESPTTTDQTVAAA